MPFVTEEIWQGLTLEAGKSTSHGRKKDPVQHTIMVQPYPKVEAGWIQPEVEKKVEFLTDIIRAIRNLRTEMNCPPSKEVKVIFSGGEEDLNVLRSQESYLHALARVGAVEYRIPGQGPEKAATAVIGSTEIYLPFSDLINLEEEETRLSKEVGKVESELARTQGKLNNQQFRTKARQEIIEKEERKAEELEEKIRTLTRSLKRIQELQSQGGS
jgi:valyl-tRNA synthetase